MGLALCVLACAAGGGGATAPAGPPAEPPNIVFLLVDDLGAMDIGAFNPDTFYETPNIDRLAAAGARLTDEALSLIDGYAADDEDRPFLLYLAYYTVHTPLQAPAELIAKYAAKAGVEPGSPANPDDFGDEEQVWPRDEPRRVREVQNHAVYAAMVETLDTSVGRVLDRLDSLDLAENTIVVFFSDNGGLSTADGRPTSNLPLRGGKGWLYEGGIREPMIVRWPAVAAAGGVTAAPVISTDFYPTVLEAAGVDLRPEIEIDGRSFLDVLRGGEGGAARVAEAAERDLFWHYPHYANQGGFPGGAIARGRYKLIERYEDGQVHLYDLDADVGEGNDLAAEATRAGRRDAGAAPRLVRPSRRRVPECPAGRPGTLAATGAIAERPVAAGTAPVRCWR